MAFEFRRAGFMIICLGPWGKGETRVIYTLKNNLFLLGKQRTHSFREWQSRQHFKNFAKILFNGSKFVALISKHSVRNQYRAGTRSGQIPRFDRVMNELFAGKANLRYHPREGQQRAACRAHQVIVGVEKVCNASCNLQNRI